MPMPEKPEAGRETCTYMSVIMATKTCFAADECLMVCFWSWDTLQQVVTLINRHCISLPSWFHEFFDSAAGSWWRHCQRTVQVFWCKASRPQGTAARCHSWLQIWFGMKLFIDLRSTDHRSFQTLQVPFLYFFLVEFYDAWSRLHT